ncbi:helix-turn-helix transcriptional regulator [Gordonia humi]|uniref:AraC-like DNA-binding protein n=1 Tax=Gordonia humi TaxID=686429 RepID=A0A840EQF2_9ACTN|nr:AraC family transcriptional regulator [Gordonia humi]MBB4133932.1 AraC-like DNA-binding protein [Gordonia humi]
MTRVPSPLPEDPCDVAGAKWAGTVTVGVGALAYSGVVGATDLHRHGAHQIVHVTTGRVSVELETETVGPTSGIVIPGGVAHALRPGPGSAVATTIYLDVDTLRGADTREMVADRPPAEWSEVFGEVVGSWPVPLDALDDRARHRPLVEHLSAVPGADEVDGMHPYVRAALDVLSERVTGRTSLGEIAAAVNVSVPHLNRLWRADMGISFPAWVRWTRLRQAARSVGAGASITDAAHEVGFADGAHASRVCREMFGMSPLELTRAIVIV